MTIEIPAPLLSRASEIEGDVHQKFGKNRTMSQPKSGRHIILNK